MYAYFKRGCDIILALILMFVLSPVFLIICIVIWIESPGSALFGQWRIGRGHRLFKLYKFRSMYVGAEKFAREIVDEGTIFAQIKNDPRVTRVGKVLRALSLDELPQFYNVLIGDMSFIGPRPFVLNESNRLPQIALRRLNVRPGITGYAQVDGRSSADVVERCARDLYYAQNLSFGLDMRILLHTFLVVLRKEGAV